MPADRRATLAGVPTLRGGVVFAGRVARSAPGRTVKCATFGANGAETMRQKRQHRSESTLAQGQNDRTVLEQKWQFVYVNYNKIVCVIINFSKS